MLSSKKNDSIRFNQGKIQILETDQNRTISGNHGGSILCGIPTIGYGRFYQARLAGISADAVVTIPRIYASLLDKDLVELERFDRKEKGIYRIVQVQDRFDSAPPCLQMTLQKEKVRYVDLRET